MLDDFFLRALAAGVGLALLSGSLGCLVVWRRMAYFGDTLAHSGLLGISLGLWFEIHFTWALILVCSTIACLLFFLERRAKLSMDTLLGLLSHSSLALGLIAIALLPSVQIDLLSYLFGDLLTVSWLDVLIIWLTSLLCLTIIISLWRAILSVTMQPDVAKVEGYPVQGIKLLIMIMLALLVAVAMKIVGVMLITALLLIPAATARRISRSPEMMASLATLWGATAVLLGLALSYYLDTPAGPSIVCAALLGFIPTLAFNPRQ